MPRDDLFSMEKYAEGFVEACEEMGVDPAALVKVAQASPPRKLTPLSPEQRQYGRAWSPKVEQTTAQEMGDPARGGKLRDTLQQTLDELNRSRNSGGSRRAGLFIRGTGQLLASPFQGLFDSIGEFGRGLTGSPEAVKSTSPVTAYPLKETEPKEQPAPAVPEGTLPNPYDFGQPNDKRDFYDRAFALWESPPGKAYEARMNFAPRGRAWEAPRQAQPTEAKSNPKT